MERDHRKEAFDFYTRIEKLREDIIRYNMETDPHIESMTPHTQVDVGFFFREAEGVLEEMRLELLARRVKLGKHLAAKLVQKALSTNSTDTSCVGNYATAKVDVKTFPVMPQRGTAEHQKLMLAMGVASEFVDHGILEPHYIRLSEYLTTKAGEGLTPLKEVISVREEVNVSYRKKKR